MSRVTAPVPLEKGPAGFFVVSSFPRELLSLIIQETSVWGGMLTFLCLPCYSAASLTCWWSTFHSPAGGSPAGRKGLAVWVHIFAGGDRGQGGSC